MERLPGFRDFYPEPLPARDAWGAEVRQYIFQQWRNAAHRYSFREYDGPPIEPLELYTTKSGEEIVGQLYNFTDKGDRAVALRAEMTPTLARMIAAHERNYKKPIKWFAIPQLFRYERQQKGRLREHFQLNADILGEAAPAADAELIALLIDSLRALKLSREDFVVRLSSRSAWQEFFDRRCADRAKAYEFYQAIDKLERDDAKQSEQKLATLGFSLADVKHFIEAGEPAADLSAVLQDLAARGLGDYVRVDYGVIRGLAYYTGVVFEAYDRKGEFRANLVRLISGGKVNVPALGFGMGDVVLTELLKERGLLPAFDSKLDVFCLIEDEGSRADSLRLIQNLRDAGLSVDYPLVAAKPDKQFKRALELGVAHTARVERVGGDLNVRIKDLHTRAEKVVGFERAAKELAGLE
jgi:histidyl-tRNA synthetase